MSTDSGYDQRNLSYPKEVLNLEIKRVYYFLSKIYKRKSILGCLTVKIMSGIENRKTFRLFF